MCLPQCSHGSHLLSLPLFLCFLLRSLRILFFPHLHLLLSPSFLLRQSLCYHLKSRQSLLSLYFLLRQNLSYHPKSHFLSHPQSQKRQPNQILVAFKTQNSLFHSLRICFYHLRFLKLIHSQRSLFRFGMHHQHRI